MARGRFLRLPLTACVALVFALVSSASADPPATLDPSSADWDGLSDFVSIASAELPSGHVVASTKLDYDKLRREDGVILVHPDPRVTDASLDAESLARFMHDGGRVVLVDDFGAGDELLAHFGIERIALPARPALMLRHNPAFALAEPASEHSVVWGVGRVVLNHASGLRHPELSPILKVRADPSGGDSDVLVAVAGAVGQGRLLAIGDASVFMNSMLRFPGNRALAASIVRYAVEDDVNGRRGGRLYVVAGPLEQSGTYGEDSSWDGALRARLRSMLGALSLLEREGAPPAVLFVCSVLVGLGIILWIGSRAGRPHTPVIPRFVREIPLAAQGGLAGHTAVVAAPGTSRVLAMLEVKSALEDQLCELLGLDKNPGHEEILREMDRRGALDPDTKHALRALFLRLARIETLILSRRGAALGRLRDAEVVQAARIARHVVHRARATLG